MGLKSGDGQISCSTACADVSRLNTRIAVPVGGVNTDLSSVQLKLRVLSSSSPVPYLCGVVGVEAAPGALGPGGAEGGVQPEGLGFEGAQAEGPAHRRGAQEGRGARGGGAAGGHRRGRPQGVPRGEGDGRARGIVV